MFLRFIEQSFHFVKLSLHYHRLTVQFVDLQTEHNLKPFVHRSLRTYKNNMSSLI